MNTTNDASGAYMGALNVAGNGSFCTTQIFVNVVNNNGGGGSSSKNIAVLVDLGTTNLASAKSGAQDFIGLVSSDTYLGVIRYGVSTKKGGSSLENSGFLEMTGSNKASAQSFAGGSTGGQVVGDAIGYAANSMLPSSGNKAIVIFTDSVSFKNGLGEFAKVFCDPNDKTSCQKASNNVNAIRDSNISVFVVDYGDGSDTSIEKTYTYSTNGQYFDGTSTSMLQVYQSLWQ
jgi:hypothetical protein